MSNNVEILLKTFEKEDALLNIIENMTPREREIISLSFSLILDKLDDKVMSEKRRETLNSKISLLSNMSDEEWEENNNGK